MSYDYFIESEVFLGNSSEYIMIFLVLYLIILGFMPLIMSTWSTIVCKEILVIENYEETK